MSLLGLIVVLIVIGVALHLVEMDARIKQSVYVLTALLVVLWVLQAFGLVGPLWDAPRPR